jgi:hypothetical protein
MGDSMDGFAQRERAFEAKYIHDEDLHFRINARRNHLFALWVAGLLKYSGDKLEKYVEDVILTDVQKTHEEDVLHKVLKDLAAAKVDMSEHRLRKEFERCLETAQKMLMNDERL